MSTIDITQEMRGITPTFQAVLNKQLAKIMDAIDDDQLPYAFRCLKTLTESLAEKDQKALMTEIDRIERELGASMNMQRMDLYLLRHTNKQSILQLLRSNVDPLFLKVMKTLHKGNYLVQYRRAVPTNVPPGFVEKVLAEQEAR